MTAQVSADFFPPLATPSKEDRRAHRRPIWCQPPQDELAALVPLRRVLASTERITLLLSHVDAYAEGCHFLLYAAVRCLPEDSDEPLPPAAPLDLVVAWEGVGIDVRATRIDGAEIVEAAGRARPMWGS